MKLVTIYYNDVFVSVNGYGESYEIYENCPYVNIDEAIAEDYAENKIENGEWDAYLIPEFIKETKIIYHDENV
jgi:hypothetical protein